MKTLLLIILLCFGHNLFCQNNHFYSPNFVDFNPTPPPSQQRSTDTQSVSRPSNDTYFKVQALKLIELDNRFTAVGYDDIIVRFKVVGSREFVYACFDYEFNNEFINPNWKQVKRGPYTINNQDFQFAVKILETYFLFNLN